jgi:hypothetical protein
MMTAYKAGMLLEENEFQNHPVEDLPRLSQRGYTSVEQCKGGRVCGNGRACTKDLSRRRDQ